MSNENELLAEIQNESNNVVSQALSINILNQDDLVYADSFLTVVKNTTKRVKEYWEEPKKAAKNAHQAICDKEKEMLTPLQDSEAIIKRKITEYREEAKRLLEEEEKRIREERQKLIEAELKKAEEFLENGDAFEAEVAKNNAMLIQNAEINTGTEIEKIKGLSFRKNFEIIIADETKVPSYINGTQIRKIDKTQIKKFVKMTNNQIPIPRNNY